LTRRPYIPHPYQLIATQHLLNVPRCSLWAGMGMGKTVSTLTAIDALYLSGEMTRPTLVLAPKRVAKNVWPAEAQKWEHLSQIDVSPIIGTEPERLLALSRDVSVYTINYDNLPWLTDHFDKTGKTWPFGMVIPDESTRLKGMRPSEQTSKTGKTFVRAAGSKRARQLARVAHTHVDRWANLSGTPAPNGLTDLWGQTWFVDKGQRLGRTFEGFRNRWFQAGFNGYDVNPLPFAAEQIHDRLRDVCLSLRAEDWFDIQKPIVRPVYVELPAKARGLYRDMERELFMQIGEHEVEAFNAAAKSQKCLQLAAGAVYVDKEHHWTKIHDEKLDALESIVAEASGMPVLVAYQWKHDAHRILEAFPKARLLDDDKQTEDDWNAGKIPMLVAHPKSCGHGLNLQDGGNILAYFSDWWDLELRDQILERIGPMRQLQSGHKRAVFVYPIIARDTIDELVLVRHETKREVQDLLIEAMRART
jgi:SNF2 family DNA or RNA helicase